MAWRRALSVIYPTETKEYPYEEPFKMAYRYFEDCLKGVDKVIVIGYSFRDPGMQYIVREVLSSNKDMQFILLCGENIQTTNYFVSSMTRNCRIIPARFAPGKEAEYIRWLREALTIN